MIPWSSAQVYAAKRERLLNSDTRRNGCAAKRTSQVAAAARPIGANNDGDQGVPAVPRELGAAPGDGHQDARGAGSKEHHSSPVESRQSASQAGHLGRQPDAERDDDKADCTKGEVDVEDPAPGRVLGKEAAYQRSHDRSHGPRKTRDGDVKGALSERHQVGQDDVVERQDASPTDALNRSPDEQYGEAMRKAADDCPHGEGRDGDKQKGTSTKVI